MQKFTPATEQDLSPERLDLGELVKAMAAGIADIEIEAHAARREHRPADLDLIISRIGDVGDRLADMLGRMRHQGRQGDV